MNFWGRGNFQGYSAGSHPTGEVNPLAIRLLRDMHLPIDGLRSKSWDEFATPDASELNFVFTVCDNAAGEVCPLWPGQPMTAHWGVENPATAEGDEVERMFAFRTAFRELENRIKIFVRLPIESLDQYTLQKKLNEIGDSKLSEEGKGKAGPDWDNNDPSYNPTIFEIEMLI